ncbi:MAG: type II toxin-antitoxin system VapC family toxin [Thiotrichaceae bacterium]
MENPLVYLETSFVSYLVARPNRDLVVAAHQNITQEWWVQRKDNFTLVISEAVLEESRRGDPDAATKRLEILKDLPLVAISEEALDFASNLIECNAVPKKAAQDALHIAVCCTNSVDFLLTWNCKHIANAEKREHIAQVANRHGYHSPVICTPEELLGE